MEHGPHVFLSGHGADDFAREAGLEQVDNRWFETPERRRQLDELLGEGGFDDEVKYGTVGAVAVDVDGHVAAATSTGGLTAKRWGRVGDSPLIGAGTYADDRAAAVSATGSGEYFIRAAAAHELAARVRIGGEPLQQALDGVLADIAALGGKGGLIAVSPVGRSGVGLHDARRCTAAWPIRAAASSRSIRTRTNGRAGPRAAIRLRSRSPRARRPGTRRPPPGSPGSGMKCAERVITGS